MTDYYDVLGVNKGATKKEIKRARDKLALRYHPDVAPEDLKEEYTERMKEINVAYNHIYRDAPDESAPINSDDGSFTRCCLGTFIILVLYGVVSTIGFWIIPVVIVCVIAWILFR